ncbi:GGDEF domain-containing protein [Aquihabitans sp. G128]|uniref:GGDEF domain-containing protein n=1 Tax=Aquihabitans sp. G128 TaxID=2849779 RepID=UPI001C241AFD|nr:GGDEF domain-containing protein [Aquihabitans sp. G128]QXC59202.1 GGDEF domain-containing protein [Aquihabitans sp. G128]
MQDGTEHVTGPVGPRVHVRHDEAVGLATGPGTEATPEMLAKLVPFLQESVMVVRAGWEVVANLTSPDGVTGRPKRAGDHAMTYVHPDDALRLFEAGSQVFQTEPGWSGATSVRLQLPDGSFRPFDLEVHNRQDDPVIQGMVLCTRPWSGTVGPISPELPADMGAALLAEHLPIGVAVLSPQGRPVFANDIAAELLGTDVATLCSGPLIEAMAPADRDRVAATVEDLSRRPGQDTFTLAVDGADAGERLIEAAFTSRAGSGGLEVQLVVLTIQDVTHRQEREQRLEHQANHDLLTGLANRAWLLDHLHVRLEQDDDLVVAFIDLDRFKAVNDRLGHVAGDAVLSAVAEGIEASLHPGECVARVGGDEFVVVAPHVDDDQSADLSQRIHLAVATVPVARRELVGVSVGLARSLPGDQPWDLLSRADAAMYEQKGRGEVAQGMARLELLAGPTVEADDPPAG